ncbi:MAG: hypothetical protein IBX55_23220 [Methyloprofundus sp.]|nr:hypothetical protein [Methyloprofundus sp.]
MTPLKIIRPSLVRRYTICKEIVEKLLVRGLHSSVVILRELNVGAKADALLDAYIATFNAVHIGRFDLEELNYFGDLQNTHGDQLYYWISKLLGFGRFANPDEQHQQIYKRTVEALNRIAQDSE